MTSNNTIEGTEWKSLPEVGEAPLVSDASSDIFSRPVDIGRHGLIYAGAQKNAGACRSDVGDYSRRSSGAVFGLPAYDAGLPYSRENDSLYNTPNTFGIYILGLTMKWLRSSGGLAGIQAANERKAARLYAEIDRTGFYRGTAQKDCRSLMNVTFRLATEDLEKTFNKEATAAGLDGLKGHRLVGGMRASIYNAFLKLELMRS
jgi:phosphoserine aminotransferase